MQSFEIEVENDFGAISRASVNLQDQLRRSGVKPRTLYALDLLIEELLTNAIRHGGLGTDDPKSRISVELSSSELRVHLEDRGEVYDPRRAAESSIDWTDLDELPIGGLGIGMVRNSVSKLSYERLGDWNRISAVIPLARDQELGGAF